MKNFYYHSCLLILVMLCQSCLTFDSQMQTGRMVKPGEYLLTAGYHLNIEHEDDGEEEVHGDFDLSALANGANFIVRRGFSSYFDLGGNFSLGVSSIEPRFSLFSGERFASALGLKWVFPTFSFDTPSLYRYKVAWYNSYEFLANLAVYVVPHVEWKLMGRDKTEYRGLSVGVVLGQENGLIIEATHAYAVKGEDPRSYQQFIIGYTWSLDKLADRFGVTEPSTGI